MLPQAKEAPGSHSTSDTANARGKTSSKGKEAQGTASRSTNKLRNHSAPEGQGSKQRGRHRPEQELEVGHDGVLGETRINQEPRRGQCHLGPPIDPEDQDENAGPRTPPGSAHGRDLARQRAIDSACPPQAARLQRIDANPEESRSPPARVFKDKNILRQEQSASVRNNYFTQPQDAPKPKRQTRAGLEIK